MHLLLLPLLALTALRVPGPLSPRNANYTIHAKLDEKQKVVTGVERLTWKNVTRGAADTMVFHLYMNAFKNDQSTFFKESKGKHRGNGAKEKGWGAIDVTKLVVGGVDLTKQLVVDETLGTVKLPQPVAPGATVEVDIEFTTKLPKVFARTGYKDDFFAVGQWFPKIGVFDCDAGPHGHPATCRWRAHQHHLNSEFFADYGVYDVDVEVGRGMGDRRDRGTDGGEVHGERNTLTFHAEDVHDFVWTTSPILGHRGQLHRRRRDAHLLLSWPGRVANVRRHLRRHAQGVRRAGAALRPLSLLADHHRRRARTRRGRGRHGVPDAVHHRGHGHVPDGVHLPECVTVHELSHQYFYGLVASDEVEEAWLDEGLTETMTDWGAARMFGREGSAWDYHGQHFSVTELEQFGNRRVAAVNPLETRAFEYESNGTYGATTYAKTVLALRTMEAYLGAAKFEGAMRHYYEKARFTHPRAKTSCGCSTRARGRI